MNEDQNPMGSGNQPEHGAELPKRESPQNAPAPSFDQKRQEKVQSFQLNLQEEDLQPGPMMEDKVAFTTSQPKQEIENLTSHSEPAPEALQPELTPEEKKAQRQSKKLEKKRKKKKAKKNGCLFKIVWMIMVVLVAIVLAQYILVGVNDMLAINRTEEYSITVEIPDNASVDQVADILVENHVINRADFFKLYTSLTRSSEKRTFSHGKYPLQSNMDYEAIINHLQTKSNREDIVSVTFYEGETLRQYAERLEEKNVCDSDAFLEACNSDQFDEDYPFLQRISNEDQRYYKLEGYLFPDTYTFYEQEEPEDVITRFLNNYNKKIVKKQKVKGYDEPMSIEDLAQERNMTPEELLTLASMVQAEAADENDMKLVAGVFLNRLSMGESYQIYTLDSDPTVFYPYKKNSVPEGFVSTYNTYDNRGLPPGPICNPGLSAIQAVLNPDKEKGYLYFCHGTDAEGKKQALYAKTEAQHKKNLKKLGLLKE